VCVRGNMRKCESGWQHVERTKSLGKRPCRERLDQRGGKPGDRIFSGGESWTNDFNGGLGEKPG